MHAAADITATCENCGCALQGAFCHACGQAAHNPLRSFSHALEEVFESFWHLDGRVFRTLRDLLVPGRVACNYLTGQRVRYIPPLRLFLVLTVLTFFIGQLTVGNDTDDKSGSGVVKVNLGNDRGSTNFAQARTEAEVQAALDSGLAGLREARAATKAVPMAGMGLEQAEKTLREEAAARVAQLRKAAPAASAIASSKQPERTATATAPGTATPSPTTAPASRQASAAAATAPAVSAPPAAKAADDDEVNDREEVRRKIDSAVRKLDGLRLLDSARPWDEKDNPVDANWLPSFGDTWLNHRLGNFERNVERMDADRTVIAHLLLAAVPSALFLLVPVFALLLKLLYLGSGRTYLEHLVVALYSHAFLVLTLLATFALSLLTVNAVAAAITVPVRVLLWLLVVPAYLLVMQRRVYRQGWPVTIVKYLALGFAYQILVGFGALYMMLAGLTSA